MRILEQEVESKYLGKGRKEKTNKAYPVLVRNSSRPEAESNDDNLELRAELDQIKAMLSETKNEMANYRCPTAQQIENTGVNSSTKIQSTKKATNYNDDTLIEKELEPLQKSKEKDSLPGSTTIIHPVKSI